MRPADLVTWWCGVLGVTDTEAVATATGIFAGSTFLLLTLLLIGIGVLIASAVVRWIIGA